jgi:putative hydrolase of the HAD superfamily
MSRPCVVFDLDDTLYLERDYVRSGFDAVGCWAATAMGLPDCGERAWQAFESGIRGSIFQTVLSQAGRTPDGDVIEQMVHVYRSHSPRISLPPDTVHCLKALSTQAVLGIITDGFVYTQQAKCRSLSLADLVDIVICTGQWGPEYYKPNPFAFQHLEQQMGPSVSRFVYVADNPAKDFHAPLALGWDVIRVRRPAGLYSSREWDTGAPPYVEVEDLWQVPALALRRFRSQRSAP